MIELPKVTSTDFTEMEGVNRVARTVTGARCIWRDTLQRDVGIDGTVEYVTPSGTTPGRLVAVQVKAGKSRFKGATEHYVPFYPEAKHRQYWREYPLPVILVLHDPTTDETIWVDARQALRLLPDTPAIQVPRVQHFDGSGVLQALAATGPLPSGEFNVDAVLREMATPDDRAQGLCFLYMFTQGMTDIGHSLYFSIEVVTEVLDILSAEWNPLRFDVGVAEYEFTDRYVDFLVQHDLARIDYSNWRQPTIERDMVGKFIAPLTEKGKAVREAISATDEALPATETDLRPYSRAIVERFVQMIFNPSGVDEAAVRQRRIEQVRLEIAESAEGQPAAADN